MDSTQIASIIAEKVVSDTKFWIAIIGIIGAIVGSLLTLIGNILLHCLKDQPKRNLDNKRKELLREMLNDERFHEKWRNLSTLAAVIGTDEQEAKRLLIDIGARGSEKNDGKWGLIKNHPFPNIE